MNLSIPLNLGDIGIYYVYEEWKILMSKYEKSSNQDP